MEYTQEIGELICEAISTSNRSLKKITESLGFGVRTVYKWLDSNEEFRHQYARAKEAQADMLAEEMLEIADDSANDTIDGEYGPMENKEWVNRSKLRVDTRKWIASKLKPKKYGDKLDLTTDGEKIQGNTIKWGDKEIGI
jgi:hypothetical protein